MSPNIERPSCNSVYSVHMRRLKLPPGAVVESVEREPRLCEIGSSVPGRPSQTDDSKINGSQLSHDAVN